MNSVDLAQSANQRTIGNTVPHLNGIQIVTLANSAYLRRPYVTTCVRSWRRISGADRPFWLLDAGLTDRDEQFAQEIGLTQPVNAAERLADFLEAWPALREIRERFITWRKMIDAIVLFLDAPHVLFIDTDVYVTVRVAFPESGFDFAYQCDD